MKATDLGRFTKNYSKFQAGTIWWLKKPHWNHLKRIRLFNDGTKNSTKEECILANHVFLFHPQIGLGEILVWFEGQENLPVRYQAIVRFGSWRLALPPEFTPVNWVSLAFYPTKPYNISALTSLVTSRSLVALISEASFHLKFKKKTETLMSALQAFEKKSTLKVVHPVWMVTQPNESSLLCHGSFRWRRRPWHHGLNEKIVRWAISPKIGGFFPQIIHFFIGFFHYFHHPFWNTTLIFWKQP